MNCPICNSGAEHIETKDVTVRSGKMMQISHCKNCHHEFFNHDPSQNLAQNHLDESRLKAAGLDIPSRDADFKNGVHQSLPYISEYISANDAGTNILEIGCSWGYFLRLLSDHGIKPYGVEINTIRSNYVNEVLKIPCVTDISEYERRNIKFNKIFLFYVIEYIPNPVSYIQRLINLLDQNGMIILITPNLDDTLKDIYCNKGFIDFFYDENSIHYFSVKSSQKMLERLNIDSENSTVKTHEGYSFINHINWFLTQKPRTTNIVGGDKFVNQLIQSVNDSSSSASPNSALSGELVNLLSKFDFEYNHLLEKYDYGNQIRIVIRKE